MTVQPLEDRDLWRGAAICAALGAGLLLPLVLLLPGETFARMPRAVSVASAVFWGVVAAVAILGFWDLYYRFFYPAWVRPLVPLDLLLYGALGLAGWWIALQLPGPPVLWFVLLGAVEGMGEHVLGSYAMNILDRVPWLQGVAATPVIVFSGFEYVVYWSLVVWLAWGMACLGI